MQGPPTAEAVSSVAAEVEAQMTESSYTAPDTLVLDVDHNQPNARKKKKKKKSKKKKKLVTELSAEGELLPATVGDGDEDGNEEDDGNDEDEKAIDSVVNPEVVESGPPLNSELGLAVIAIPAIVDTESDCEEKAHDNVGNTSKDEESVGKYESLLEHQHPVGSTQAEHIHYDSAVVVQSVDQYKPLSYSMCSLVSPPSPPPSSSQPLPLPPVTPFPAQEKGYAPPTVDKTSTQLLRNALFSPVSAAKASSTATPTATTAAIEVRRINEVIESANERKELHLQLQLQPPNDSDEGNQQEKGPTLEELTNSLHEFEDFFYTSKMRSF